MKQQILTLMISAAVFGINPAFGRDEESTIVNYKSLAGKRILASNNKISAFHREINETKSQIQIGTIELTTKLENLEQLLKNEQEYNSQLYFAYAKANQTIPYKMY